MSNKDALTITGHPMLQSYGKSLLDTMQNCT